MKKNFTLFVMFALFTFGFTDFLCLKELSFIKSTDTYKRIRYAIDKIGVIDGHEHLVPEDVILEEGIPDFFDICVIRHYIGRSDIPNIGNTFPHDERYLDKSLPVEERWQSFLPIYQRLKNTGYMRCVREGFRKVYNIEITDASSVKQINERLKKSYKPGIYKKILYDLGNIDCVLNNYHTPEGYSLDRYPDFFRGLINTESLILFTKKEEIDYLEKRFENPIHSLDDLKETIGKFIDESRAMGMVGFKSTAAYYRSLDFSPYSEERAAALLKKLISKAKRPGLKGDILTLEEGKELSNFCMHMLLQILEEKGSPLAIHTGLLTLGQNDIRMCHPHHLIPLFKEYKNLNFDIYHGGFPYVTEFIELGKSWPNVYLNLCWNHIITPEGARAQLSELIECVPVNKIFAFGGDVRFPELVIGHLEIAKENCAIVLAEKVLNGYFTEEEAIEYAHRILRTNLIEFYKLKIPKRG